MEFPTHNFLLQFLDNDNHRSKKLVSNFILKMKAKLCNLPSEITCVNFLYPRRQITWYFCGRRVVDELFLCQRHTIAHMIFFTCYLFPEINKWCNMRQKNKLWHPFVFVFNGMEEMRYGGWKKSTKWWYKKGASTTIYHPFYYERKSDKHSSIQLMCSTLSCARMANAASLVRLRAKAKLESNHLKTFINLMGLICLRASMKCFKRTPLWQKILNYHLKTKLSMGE